MRLLFTHPFFWPYVHRGAEREVHDIGAALARRGHDVHLVTTQPHGVTRGSWCDGMRVRYVRTPVPGPLAGRGVSSTAAFAAVTALAAVASRADLVHCFHYADVCGVVAARRLRGHRRPVVLKLTGTVRAERIDRLPVESGLFRRAIASADAVWCNSAFAVDEMAEFGVPMEVVPAGLDLSVFAPCAARAERPTVLAASASEDPRKRFEDLVAAWPHVVAAVPDARLRIAGAASEELRRSTLERMPAAARGSVTFLGALAGTELAQEYSAAWASVTMAVYEALGLTTLESLACATPVAAARSGAAVELLTDPRAGWLFEPIDPQACAAVLVAALQQPPDAARALSCRAVVAPYSWDLIIPRILDGYRRVLEAT